MYIYKALSRSSPCFYFSPTWNEFHSFLMIWKIIRKFIRQMAIKWIWERFFASFHHCAASCFTVIINVVPIMRKISPITPATQLMLPILILLEGQCFLTSKLLLLYSMYEILHPSPDTSTIWPTFKLMGAFFPYSFFLHTFNLILQEIKKISCAHRKVFLGHCFLRYSFFKDWFFFHVQKKVLA